MGWGGGRYACYENHPEISYDSKRLRQTESRQVRLELGALRWLVARSVDSTQLYGLASQPQWMRIGDAISASFPTSYAWATLDVLPVVRRVRIALYVRGRQA